MIQKDENSAKKAVKDAKKALDFLFDKFAEKNLKNGIDGETKFLDSFFFFLKLGSRPIEIDDFIGKLAQKLNRSRQIIQDEFKRYLSKNKGREKRKKEKTTKKKLSSEESFAGFIGAFPDTSRKLVGAKAEAFLKYFNEPKSREILQKFFTETEMELDEKTLFNAWIMEQENLYGDMFSVENQKKEFKKYFAKMKTKKQKASRSQNDLERFYATQK
jgi:hypothetical protein